MKKVTGEIRIIMTLEDKQRILENPATLILPGMIGYWEHKDRYYKYIGTIGETDYFEEASKPLEIGILEEHKR